MSNEAHDGYFTQHVTGTWTSIDEECPLNCTVEGSDLATIVIGGEEQSVELIFNAAAGLHRLVDTSTRAATDMDALFEQENAARDARGPACGVTQDGAKAREGEAASRSLDRRLHSSDLLGSFTGEGDIHIMFDDPDDELHVVIERSTLTRWPRSRWRCRSRWSRPWNLKGSL